MSVCMYVRAHLDSMNFIVALNNRNTKQKLLSQISACFIEKNNLEILLNLVI